jgi:hypothetical protein
MAGKGYQKNILGSTQLLIAADHLRDLARLEFSYGNFEEGVFEAQIALDLEKIARGEPIRTTAAWRAYELQFPSVFSGQINQRLSAALLEAESDSKVYEQRKEPR